MIKLSLKNYLKCLAHIFVPLGCIFLGVLFGASVFFDVATNAVAYVKDEAVRLLSGIEADFDELWSFVIASGRELDWSRPFDTVRMLLQGDWLAAKIATFLGMTAEQYAQFAAAIQTVLANVGRALIGGIFVFLSFVVIGAIAGYFVTGMFVRKSTVKRGFWKFIAANLLDSLFSATLIALTVWLFSVWRPSVFISSAISMLVFGFVSLCEAYVLHGKTLKFRTVVSVKNCYLIQLASLLIFVISLAIVGIVFAVTNTLVALFIGLSVMIIAFLVGNVNAEAYVVMLAEAQNRNAPDANGAEKTEGENAA